MKNIILSSSLLVRFLFGMSLILLSVFLGSIHQYEFVNGALMVAGLCIELFVVISFIKKKV